MDTDVHTVTFIHERTTFICSRTVHRCKSISSIHIYTQYHDNTLAAYVVISFFHSHTHCNHMLFHSPLHFQHYISLATIPIRKSYYTATNMSCHNFSTLLMRLYNELQVLMPLHTVRQRILVLFILMLHNYSWLRNSWQSLDIGFRSRHMSRTFIHCHMYAHHEHHFTVISDAWTSPQFLYVT